jgi:two-component system chemotaxis response regulator CheB
VAIRTLIVDDSAFARKVVREVLSVSAAIEIVGAARDGMEALDMTATLNPDVVLCDLQMPVLDGVGFVRRQMQIRPLPILILSAAAEDGEEIVSALGAGAVDVVRKPSALANDDLRTVQSELIDKLVQAAGISARNLPRASELGVPPAVRLSDASAQVDLVAIGISTGGPQALRRMLPLFPANFPVPIAIVLHMPIGYTAAFAAKLDETSQLEVKEAEDGDVLRPGRALLAQAGRHLSFRRKPDGSVVAQLSMLPVDKIHRPSVDVLFRSAADIFGSRVLSVVMTGMGDDGLEGSSWVKARGGSVITEAEKSCVIYGMPRSVEEAGLSDASIPLDEMASEILKRS